MNYITEIFDRLNLQQISSFLLDGTEMVNISEQTYKQCLDNARKPMIEIIEKKFSNLSESEEVLNYVSMYASVTQDVYMQIGIQCGASLVAQLLLNPKKE